MRQLRLLDTNKKCLQQTQRASDQWEGPVHVMTMQELNHIGLSLAPSITTDMNPKN